ncbi:MAG: YncE family protein [Candidatus Eisenbacteria sp.]|nr:YncE family protein [Candidatus Eisenbacteria bacterium]
MRRNILAVQLICGLVIGSLPAMATTTLDPAADAGYHTIVVEPGQTVNDFLPAHPRDCSQFDIDPGIAPEGDYLHLYTFTRDGQRALVTNRHTDNVTVFNWSTMAVITNIAVGDFPGAIATSDDYAIVACAFSNEVYIIDLTDYSIDAIIPTDEQPWVIRISQDQHYAYVACDINDVCEVIDLQTLTHVRTLPNVPISLLTVSWCSENGRNWYSFTNFEVTPDGSYLIVPDRQTSIHYVNTVTGNHDYNISGPQTPVTVRLSGDGQKAIVNTAHDLVAVWQFSTSVPPSSTGLVTIIGYTISMTYDMAVNYDGSKAFVAISGNRSAIVRFDTYDSVIITDTYTPFWIGVSPDHIYAVSGQNRFSIVDFAAEAVVGQIEGVTQYMGCVSPVGYRAVSSDPMRFEGPQFYDFTNVSAPVYRGRTQAGEEPEGDAPRRVAITPDGGKAVVCNVLSGNVTIVNLDTYAIEAVLWVSDRVQDVAITSDSHWAVACGMESNSVSIIDLTMGSVAAVVPTNQWPAVVSITPDDAYAYIGNLGSNTISVVALNGAASYELTEIGGVGSIGIVWATYGVSSDVRVSPDGAFCLVAASGSDWVTAIQTSTNNVVANILVGSGSFPIQIGFTDDGQRAIVTECFANAALLIDMTWPIPTPAGTIGVGEYPLRLDYDRTRDEMGIGDYSGRVVYRIDPQSGNCPGIYDYTAYGYIHDVQYDDFTGDVVVVTGPVEGALGHVHRGDDVVQLPAIPAAFDYHSPLIFIPPNPRAEHEAIAAVVMPGPDYLTVIKYAVAGVKEVVTIPLKQGAVLLAARPNLVQSATRLGFALARSGSVELSLVDISGRQVATLGSGHYGAGHHEISWHSGGVAAGLYQAVLKLQGRTVDSQRIVILDGGR